MAQELIVAPCLYNELLSGLDRIRLEFRCLDQGYRLSLYQLMADAMSIALAIEADPESNNEFLKHVEQESDVVYAAMIFITEAKSEGARKKAWKGARALRYLVEEVSVPVDKIPEAMRERGGVEKLARLAAQGQPRRKPSAPKPNDDGAGGTEPEGGGGENQLHVNGGKQRGRRARVERQIQLGATPEILAKLVDFADNSPIQISGVLRARAGMPLSIEVEDITDEVELARDWLD